MRGTKKVQAVLHFDSSSGHSKWPDDALLANNINFYWGGKGSTKMGDIVLENDYPNSNLLRPLTDEAQGTLARIMLNLSDYSVK